MNNLNFLTIDEYNDSDIHEICEAYNKCNQRKTDYEEWFNRLTTSPFGNAISIIAKCNNEICGVLSFGRYEVMINDKIYKSVISYTTFVVPNYRGLGVFSKMIHRASSFFQELNIDIAFNFPNSNSLSGFKNNSWIQKNEASFYLRFHKFNSVFKLMSLFFFKNIYDKEEDKHSLNINSFIDELNHLDYNTNNYSNSITLNYNKEFLLWRFTKGSRYKNYKLIKLHDSFIIYKLINRGKLKECQLMLLHSDSNSVYRVKKLIFEIFKKEKQDITTVYLSNNHYFKQIIQSNFYIRIDFLKKLNFTYIILNDELKSKIENEEINWNLATLDLHTS
jgi:hypothetical protein